VISKEPLLALVRPSTIAVNCFVPTESTVKPLNDAVPLLMSSEAVPTILPVSGTRVSVTVLPDAPFDDSLPNWSCVLTTGWVLKLEPYTVVAPGGVVKASFVTVPGIVVRVPKFVLPSVTPTILASEWVMLLVLGVVPVGLTLRPPKPTKPPVVDCAVTLKEKDVGLGVILVD